MNVLSIHTERAQLEIHSEPAKVTISNSRPTFVINHTKPQMHVVRQMPQFNIEWEEIPGTGGQAATVQLSRQFGGGSASQSSTEQTESAEAIKTILSGDALGGIVKESNTRARPTELKKQLVPQKRASIEWETGVFEVQWTKPSIEIEWDTGNGPTIEVEPYYVEIHLKNQPSVVIRVNHENLRNGVGDRVDERV